MNYLKEINALYDWIEFNPLTPSAIILWYALMHINNKTGWTETFTVPLSILEAKTGLKRDALYRARNKLKQEGRIDWQERAGRQATVYKIIPFESQITTQTAIQTATQTATQTAIQTVTQTANINKQNKNKTKKEYPPTSQTDVSAPCLPPLVCLMLKDGTAYEVTGEAAQEWSAAYRAIDCTEELRKMAAWCKANPDKRKTRNGVQRFINNWLNRANSEAKAIAAQELPKKSRYEGIVL